MVAVPARVRLALMAVATMVLLAALGVVLFAGTSSGDRAGGFEGAVVPQDVKTTDFALRDQDGKLVRLSDYLGQPVMVTFLYTTCQDTCPLTAQQMKAAQQQVGRSVPALAVSVDPANDTPLNAKRFLAKHNVAGHMRFLLGSRAQLAPIWKAYAIQPQGNGFEHSARVLLFDAGGRERVAWPSHDLTPEGLANDLRLLLR
jgi:protein SCO1/2